MEAPDARRLSIETQEYLKQQAIRLRSQGKRISDISEYLGVHRNTVSEWWWEYQHYGEVVFTQQQRGRKVGDGRILDATAEETVVALMSEQFPEDYGIDSALWTARAVQALIEQSCGVKLPIRSVREYLRRWGYSVQKPLQRAYEQDCEALKQWLEVSYPAIVERVKQEGAAIEWGDESGLRSDEYGGRGYAPVGKTPEIRPSQRQRARLNFIASLSAQGRVQFMLYRCKLSGAVFIEFLKRLVKSHQQKVFWIVDRHPVHRQPAVREWLAQQAQKIELFYLPSYSPEANPVEYLNCDVKQAVHDKPPSRNPEQLQQRLLRQLRKLQKLPARIRKYFEHPSIAYAAL